MATRGRTAGRRTGPEDAAIGERVRSARLTAGETQTQLATLLGLTFQQVQKYERGTNRISAVNMERIASHYGHPVEWFMPSTHVNRAMDVIDFITDASAARLNKAFAKVQDSDRRREIVRAVEIMCESPA